MAIAIVDAARQLTRNKEQHRELRSRHEALTERCEQEQRAQDDVRRRVYDEALLPFRASFARLKNVDLAELAPFDVPAGAELPGVELSAVRMSVSGLTGAIAGGLGSGAGAGAATYTAVGTFAAASTGTPIATLSGAAATNATMAFLGGGSLAAGGGGIAAGTMVLSGVVAAPVVVAGAAFVTWQGRKQRRIQRETAASLATAEADLAVDEARIEAVLIRSGRVRLLIADLRRAVESRLSGLGGLVATNDDYATYTPAQRADVASLVGLVTATVALMAAPLADTDGSVSDLCDGALAAARGLLHDGEIDGEVAA